VITLVAFLLVAIVALPFDRNIGFTAITAAVLLTALFPTAQEERSEGIAPGGRLRAEHVMK